MEELERRVAAIERALTDAETPPPETPEADLAVRVDDLEERLSEIETRLDDLDGAVQAVRGYVGGVDGNRDERSAGWPCPGDPGRSTDRCIGE